MPESSDIKLLDRLNQYTAWFSKIAGGIGAISAAIMAMLSTTDVFLRYFFNSPIRGTLEVVELLMLITVLMFMIYATMQKSHIIVDVLVSRLPAKASWIHASIISILCTLIFGFVLYSALLEIPQKYADRVESAILNIPIYPFVIVIAIASLFITWIFLLAFLNNINRRRDK